MSEHFDVVVVGAGLSGIGAGHHLRARCPDRSFVILEGRERIGGTWDLFRYPGVRSDSDMFTLGYAFKPWTASKAIADGPSILGYLNETVAEDDLGAHIRFQHRVVSAAWSSRTACWTVEVDIGRGRERVRFTCSFLYMCSGYYDYARGFTPEFAGTENFAGKIVHPQFWPADLEYAGKRVVVIGSGATAVTLVPEMAKRAAAVTMLQRSPSYVVSMPSGDRVADRLRKWLPAGVAHAVIRWRNVIRQQTFYQLARRRPEAAKKWLLKGVRGQLGQGFDVDRHFTPRYNPWDQRVCVVPDADLFQSIRDGAATIVTGEIERFVANGIKLSDGADIPADIIVTATGLELQLMSGIPFCVDGERVDPSQSLNYRGMMYSGIPNLASSFGYTNASWTLKADLTSGYVCRLMNAMRKRGVRQCTPRIDGALNAAPFLEFTSSYVQRGIDRFPGQGDRSPWKVHQNYARDLIELKYGSIDREMEFSNPEPARVT